jgi:hypothetical protein
VQNAPVDVARSFFDAFEGGQWERLSAMLDPDEIARLRDEHLALLTSWAQHRPDKQRDSGTGTRIYSFTSEPTADPATLERFADTPIPAFRGRPTLGQVAAMSPVALVAEWFAASFGGPGRGVFGVEGAPSARHEILGAVAEGDNMAHVVYRPNIDGAVWHFPWHVAVLSLKSAGDGGWLVLENDELRMGRGVSHMLFHPADGSGETP